MQPLLTCLYSTGYYGVRISDIAASDFADVWPVILSTPHPKPIFEDSTVQCDIPCYA